MCEWNFHLKPENKKHQLYVISTVEKKSKTREISENFALSTFFKKKFL